jgi:hypothetical protein
MEGVEWEEREGGRVGWSDEDVIGEFDPSCRVMMRGGGGGGGGRRSVSL